MIYYKVVRVDRNGKIYSAIKTPLEIEYKIGEWVFPHKEHTSLMCFTNLNDATLFYKAGYGSAIFECEVKNPKKKGVFVSSVFDDYFEHMVDKIIKLKKNKKRFFDTIMYMLGKSFKTSHPNPNVVYCNAIKITKQVYL